MRIKDILTKIIIKFLFLINILILISILSFIIYKGFKEINLSFIFDSPTGMPQGTEGGIFPAIVGSFYSMTLAMIISAILAVLTAVFNTYFNKFRLLREGIRFIIKNIAGLPSIIFALFGYGMFIVIFGIEKSLLTLSLTLAMMVFPFIEINTEKVFEELDQQMSIDSRALGVSKEYTVFKLILPYSFKKILSTILLAGSYAAGATAPVILTGAVLIANVPDSIMKPVMVLPFHLNMLLSQGISVEKAYGTSLVLIILVFLTNLGSLILERRGNSVRNR